MNSSMISKIDKAHRYAQEPDRVRFSKLEATFRGGHDDYTVELNDGVWTCTCHTFESRVIGETCSHIMAMQQMFADMLTEKARFAGVEPVPVN